MRAFAAHKHTPRVLASVALVAGAATVAGLGTFGTFTSSTSANTAVQSGTVTVNLADSGSAKGLSVAASNVVPGDQIQRVAVLKNTGDTDFGGVTMTTAATPSSILDQSPDGLQLRVDSCSTPWADAGNGSYTCAGTTNSVVTSRPVVGSNLALPLTDALNTGTKAANLRFTMSLPDAAGNEFQGKTSTINYTFTATQRAGSNR